LCHPLQISNGLPASSSCVGSPEEREHFIYPAPLFSPGFEAVLTLQRDNPYVNRGLHCLSEKALSA